MTNIVLHITADESEADKEARGGRVRPFRETFMGTMLPVAKLYLFTMSKSVHEKQTNAKDNILCCRVLPTSAWKQLQSACSPRGAPRLTARADRLIAMRMRLVQKQRCVLCHGQNITTT